MGRRSGKLTKSRNGKQNNAGDVDRLSELPNSIFYCILSHLHPHDIAHLSFLSDRLRSRCLLTSNVRLNLDDIEKAGGRPCFIDFLKKFSKLRKGIEMKYFHLRWFHPKLNSDESLCITDCVRVAAKCNTLELDIDFKAEEGKALELPECGSVRVCYLNLYNGMLQLPSVGFNSLRDLSLKSVHIVCDGFGELISSCKFLNKLSLEDFTGVDKLIVTSSSLQEIRIVKLTTDDLQEFNVSARGLETIDVKWFFSSCTNKVFKLSAPSLQMLDWTGDTVNYCHLGKFTSLEGAFINLRHHSMLTSELSSTEEASINNCLVDVIRSVSGARTIRLNCWHVEMFAQDCQPTSFDNLQELVVKVFDLNNDHQVPAVVSFLKLLPNLQTLAFKCCYQPWGFNATSLPKGNNLSILMGDESQNLFIHLESVEIELTGGEKEIELIKYLLNHARALKKMAILYSSTDSLRSSKIAKALQEFKKASSNVAMFFLPYC